MYQFYYADFNVEQKEAHYSQNVKNEYSITAIRPTMWEEHCLECSAPLCFENCLHYEARRDGRCKRFHNGLLVRENEWGCCGQATRVKFRKWANMMTILFPAMLSVGQYQKMVSKNQRLGKIMGGIIKSSLPLKLRWESVRTVEFIRRRALRKLSGLSNEPDAFIFHGYSFEEQPFRLIVEMYDSHTPVFKTSLKIEQGENLIILDKEKLDKACWTDNFLVKVYPENNLEAELDILWCDFVQGERIVKEEPAQTVKCVVWDLDNTLWDGTLIETESFETLQLKQDVLKTIQQLDERGIIQSIASKNDFDAAWNVIERLGLADYFLYPQIHWNAKSSSVEQVAKSLNIGIDALALIDDSVFEREQVKSVWKQVRTYDAIEVSGLLDKPEFDVMVTEESKNRRKMYKAEEKRNQLMLSDDSDTIAFLKKCNLRMEIFRPETEEEKLRCYELVVRTNQLNMSGMKYTQEEFDTVLAREDHTNLAFSCEDDFGAYGIVGFGQYKVEDSQMIFTEFAMSCRVAGKYVESALFYTLLEKEQCMAGVFSVNKTKKNILLRNTLHDIGFVVKEESEERIQYQFDKELKEKLLVKTTERN